MDDRQYQQIADVTLRDLETMFADVDAEDVDCERAGDVITLTFKTGKKAVVNTQRPTRQIWLAANARAWHFDWEPSSKTWIDDKGQGLELFAQLSAIVKETSGLAVPIPVP